MSITFLPTKLVKKIAPKSTIKKLVSDKNLTLNRTVLKTVQNLASDKAGIKSDVIEEVALTVIKEYKQTFKDEMKAGATKTEALDETLNGKKLMVQRVQNAVVKQVAKKIKRKYKGTRYRWLPSDAVTPRALHQLRYGKVYRVGKGEMPGDEPGCQCGMEILTDDTDDDNELGMEF